MKNKKVRLYVNGKREKDIYLYKTKWEVFKIKTKRFVKRLLKLALILAIAFGIYKIGNFTSKKVVYETKEITVEVLVEESAPVLARIAKAESMDSHYCNDKLINAKLCAKSEKGQVLLKANNNKTIDVGRYQINTFYWGEKATELGLDITDEEDNYKMAKWIYANYGTDPWSASSKNW